MKKFLFFAGLGILIIFLGTPFFRSSITNFPSENQGVLAFGDSLVQGIGSTNGGGFVKSLSDKLNTPILNLGKSGDTTATALKRLDSVTMHKPAVSIILLGGNDFLQGTAEEETIKNLSTLIESIHAIGSAVILVGVEADTPGNHHRAIFEGLAKQYQTAYVPDVLDGIYGNSDLMSDNLHPNDRGYEIMAERILPVLEKLLP